MAIPKNEAGNEFELLKQRKALEDLPTINELIVIYNTDPRDVPKVVESYSSRTSGSGSMTPMFINSAQTNLKDADLVLRKMLFDSVHPAGKQAIKSKEKENCVTNLANKGHAGACYILGTHSGGYCGLSQVVPTVEKQVQYLVIARKDPHYTKYVDKYLSNHKDLKEKVRKEENKMEEKPLSFGERIKVASAPSGDDQINAITVVARAQGNNRRRECENFLKALSDLVNDPNIEPKPDSFKNVANMLKQNEGKNPTEKMNIIQQFGNKNRGFFGSAKELIGKRSQESIDLYKTLAETTTENANNSKEKIANLHNQMKQKFNPAP